MPDYPAMIVPVNHVEPVPRRIRAFLGDALMIDTTQALYVWEWPGYPQYAIPVADVRDDALIAEGLGEPTSRGPVAVHGLQFGSTYRKAAAQLFTDSPVPGLTGMLRFDWNALDRWYEEDEQVFVHPRSPYTRVDALRSTRAVRIELEGVVLAESAAPVLVFETGLPTRYYLDRTSVFFEHLIPSETVSRCPYKGTTSEYWSVAVNGRVEKDLAWAYDFPTRQLLPIAGLVAFYNEKVDVVVDGRMVERAVSHFS